LQSEARKAELETNLTTNLKRRKQELEAVISSVDADSMLVDAELKRKELSDAKILVDDASNQLKSEIFSQCSLLSIAQIGVPCLTNFFSSGVFDSIHNRIRQIAEIKDEMNKLKVFFSLID
jgi:structural maintenance of chromosome 3 (chondroitin sulfate proteoglycan 6)